MTEEYYDECKECLKDWQEPDFAPDCHSDVSCPLIEKFKTLYVAAQKECKFCEKCGACVDKDCFLFPFKKELLK